MQTHTEPVTKYGPPSPTPGLILRPRLMELLGETVARHPILLVAAPAGYGKSTLVAAYCRDHLNETSAWLSIDEEENDPFRFIASLAEAVRHAFGEEGPASAGGSALPDPESIPFAIRQRMSGWIHEIVSRTRTPFVLVLDDLHKITEAPAYLALDFLLEHLPPDVKVILSTRYDPPVATARYRARGRLGEIRAAHLRFSTEEARAFCRKEMGDMIPEGELQEIEQRLDGWPAGFGLLAYSLRLVEDTERDAFLTGLARSESYLFEFLAEEIFNRQEPEVRKFLLETSVLDDLTPGLCRAVTGRNDTPALLVEVSRRNLLMVTHAGPRTESVPDAISGKAYRYHDLIKRFLRERLHREDPQMERELHRKAAAAETDLSKQMRHALAAQMWAECADLIEANADALLSDGLFETVKRWIKSIPADRHRQRPKLMMYLGLTDMLEGEFQRAEARLAEAARIAERLGDHTTAANARAHEASLAIVDERPQESARIIETALAGPLPDPARLQLKTALARIHMIQGDWSQATALLDEAVTRLESGATPALLQAFSAHLHPSFITLPEGIRLLGRAVTVLQRGRHEANHPAINLAAAAQQAFVNLWQGRNAGAVSNVDEALVLLKRHGTGSPFTLVGIYITALQAYMSVHLGRRTEQLFEDALATARSMGLKDAVVPAFFFLLGKFGWLTGRGDLVGEAVQRLAVAEKSGAMPSTPFFRSALNGIACAADGKVDEAVSFFRKAMAFEESRRISMLFGSARALLSHLYFSNARAESALAEFVPLLQRAEQEHLPGLVTREASYITPLLSLAREDPQSGGYATGLLESLRSQRQKGPVPVPGSTEHLTVREVEVMRCLAAGLRNREIADQLSVTERTVKAHVSNIMAKLGASTRTEAAIQARELGIVT